MKASEQFKQTIQAYLMQRATEDESFAARLNLPSKSIDECVNFILNTVQQSGCNGFSDPEIYGIAVHYYDEDVLDPKYLKEVNCNVVINHQVELTQAEKDELAAKAKKDFYDECVRKQREALHKTPKKAPKKDDNQLTLF